MSVAHSVFSSKSASTIAAVLPFMLAPSVALADTDMTAGVIIERMTGNEQAAFFSGLIEGLAYARYQKDGQKVEGMKCIYHFYYDKEGTVLAIVDAFTRFPDYTPGTVLAAMVAKECGN